jgi:hypothetical protein
VATEILRLVAKVSPGTIAVALVERRLRFHREDQHRGRHAMGIGAKVQTSVFRVSVSLCGTVGLFSDFAGSFCIVTATNHGRTAVLLVEIHAYATKSPFSK